MPPGEPPRSIIQPLSGSEFDRQNEDAVLPSLVIVRLKMAVSSGSADWLLTSDVRVTPGVRTSIGTDCWLLISNISLMAWSGSTATVTTVSPSDALCEEPN